MTKRTLKVALVVVFALALLFSMAGVALAQWSDINLSLVGQYGITEQQLGQISQGFTDGSWKPYMDMPRNQFVKMAVTAYKIPLVNPATPTYTDVPKTDYYYQYIEAATAANLTNGIGGGKFAPNDTITREQAAAIIVRWVSAKNGYDLDTYYTDAEAEAILDAFPDAGSVGPSLTKEIAFAIDFGIVWGTADGKIAPKKPVLRIQGAAMLIRSWAIIPEGPVPPPAKIELVGTDKAENLIGLTHQATFKVTDADGKPVKGALVDFDTIISNYYYVGNVSPQAALTDKDGKVTVNLISTEPGTERVSASVKGVPSIYTTKYWVALDEVYILDHTREAQNNVGTPHSWEARVVVFGPGPLSTSAQDWYNAFNPNYDPNNIKDVDAVDFPLGWVETWLKTAYQQLLPLPGFDSWDELAEWVSDAIDEVTDTQPPLTSEIITTLNTLLSTDRWTWDTEQLAKVHGLVPRSLSGIPVEWKIIPWQKWDADLEKYVDVASVGEISAVKFNGSIAADKKSAVGYTDATGLTGITIDSTAIGKTNVQAVADYQGNPYPKKLFNHLTFQAQYHFLGWDDQPQRQATALKTWISHTLPPGGDNPISPAYQAPNIGEQKTLTITLKDQYGNPVADRLVEWFMEGVGWFDTDDWGTTKDPDGPDSVDIDYTDANGQAKVMVKSFEAGEQIVHAKVRDKGTAGNGAGGEGINGVYTAEVQWFDVNVATFDDITTNTILESKIPLHERKFDDRNEASSTNPVGDEHTFTLGVYGLKLELFPLPHDRTNQSPWIDSDAPGSAYDGKFDAKDAAYFGGILLVNQYQDDLQPTANGNGKWPFDANENGIIDDVLEERGTVVVQGPQGDLIFTGVGGYTEFDWNNDCNKEPFEGQSGIYLPLAGKNVTFAKVDSLINCENPESALIDSVGTFTPEKAVTDEYGKADVTVSSDEKGPETIQATVNWKGNPHNGPELVKAYAKKHWKAQDGEDVKIVVSIDGEEVVDNIDEDLEDVSNPLITGEGYGDNVANIEVHVYDEFGNDLPDYEVVYLLEGIGTWLGGSQGAANTYIPLAGFTDTDPTNTSGGSDYDLNGDLPDSDEPCPDADPYATIIGDSHTSAFYFNQWLGPNYPAVDSNGDPINPNGGDVVGLPDSEWVNGWDWYDYYEDGTYLIPDGAKAWTLDGYNAQFEWYEGDWQMVGDIFVNKLTGSNVDVQLLEDPTSDASDGYGAQHYKTIVKILVYAPTDGIAPETADPIWHFEVHKVWEQPRPASITLTPSFAVNPAGSAHTVTATVKDQFGDPYEGQQVDFSGVLTEGSDNYPAGVRAGNPQTSGFTVSGPSDADGKVTATYAGNGTIPYWGSWTITASMTVGTDIVTSNNAVKYYAKPFTATYSSGVLTIAAGALDVGNDDRAFNVRFGQPTAAVVGTGTYNHNGTTIVNVNLQSGATGTLYLEFPSGTYSDGIPNWYYYELGD